MIESLLHSSFRAAAPNSTPPSDVHLYTSLGISFIAHEFATRDATDLKSYVIRFLGFSAAASTITAIALLALTSVPITITTVAYTVTNMLFMHVCFMAGFLITNHLTGKQKRYMFT